MTNVIISKLAKACMEFSKSYDPQGEEVEGFLEAWRGAYAAYQWAVTACPSCDSDDPGDPPPP